MQLFLTEKLTFNSILLLSLLLISGSLSSYAQVLTDTKNQPRKVENTSMQDELFVETSYLFTNRTLFENPNGLGGDFKTKDKEEGDWATHFNVGLLTYFDPAPIFASFGVGFIQNKVSYQELFSDSIYEFAKTYRYLSFPLLLGYYNRNNGFYTSAGFSINHLFSSKTTIAITRNNANTINEENITSLPYTKIHFFGHFSIGLKRSLTKNVGYFINGRVYHQFTNTYKPLEPYVRREYGVGISLGIHAYL